jgi:hypothetical protein
MFINTIDDKQHASINFKGLDRIDKNSDFTRITLGQGKNETILVFNDPSRGEECFDYILSILYENDDTLEWVPCDAILYPTLDKKKAEDDRSSTLYINELNEYHLRIERHNKEMELYRNIEKFMEKISETMKDSYDTKKTCMEGFLKAVEDHTKDLSILMSNIKDSLQVYNQTRDNDSTNLELLTDSITTSLKIITPITELMTKIKGSLGTYDDLAKDVSDYLAKQSLPPGPTPP